MSCQVSEKAYEMLADEIIFLWKIKDRDDLLDDCIEYVVEKFRADESLFYKEFTVRSSVKSIFLEWLQHKVQISGVLSNQDLEKMAMERKQNVYKNLTKKCLKGLIKEEPMIYNKSNTHYRDGDNT